MDVINPATGEREEMYEEDTHDDVDAALGRATSAFGERRDRSVRDRGERVVRRVDAGCVYINQFVKSDSRVPFGGIEEPGYGRELFEGGITEFVNRETVWVE